MTALPKTPLLRPRRRRPTWSIRVDKEYLKFSAAHFLIFDDGSAERLHGHNYRVCVDLSAWSTSNGIVIDFKQLKPIIAAVLATLDERLVIPGAHPLLSIREHPAEHGRAAETEIRFADRRYVVPTDEVTVLPIGNSSAENLAEWIVNALCDAIDREFPNTAMRSLSVGVEETAGQRGIYTVDF